MGAQREWLRSELGAHLCGGWWGSFPTPTTCICLCPVGGQKGSSGARTRGSLSAFAGGFVALGELLHLSVSFCLVSLELDRGHVCGARHGCLTCVRASPPLLCMRPVTTTRDSPSHPQPPLTSPQSGGQRRPAQQ